MTHTIRLALYEPDIAANVGAIIRMSACLGIPLDIIEPCGFAFSMHAVRRQVMDYADHATIERHDSWEKFRRNRTGGRLIALTTQGASPLWGFSFQPGDCLLMGRESAGLPNDVHAASDARVVIPMAEGPRSLNIGMAAAIAVAEALRQISLLRHP